MERDPALRDSAIQRVEERRSLKDRRVERRKSRDQEFHKAVDGIEQVEKKSMERDEMAMSAHSLNLATKLKDGDDDDDLDIDTDVDMDGVTWLSGSRTDCWSVSRC